MHVHISGLNALVTALMVIAVLGTLNLVAMKYQEKSSFWASYANLFGLS